MVLFSQFHNTFYHEVKEDTPKSIWPRSHAWARVVLVLKTRDVPLLGGGGATLHRVPRDVGIDKGDRIRFCFDVLEFNQVMRGT